MPTHLLHLRAVATLTADERAAFAALPRPNPSVGGKIVLRRREGVVVRVHAGQAQIRACSRFHWSEGETLSDLVNTPE